MNDIAKNIMNWVLDRLGEQSTWKGIVGLATAAGATISPDNAVKIIAVGMGLIALINGFRNEKKSTAVAVQKVLATNGAVAPDAVKL